MDTTRLVLDTIRGIAQLAGGIKRQVTSFTTLTSLANSIEVKANCSESEARRLNDLTNIEKVSGDLFQFFYQDLKGIEEKLSSILQQIEPWKRIDLHIFQSPIITETLTVLENRMSQVGQFIHMVRTLGSVISSQRAGMPDVICAFSSFRPLSENSGTEDHAMLEFKSQLQTRNNCCAYLEHNAEFAYLMGLNSYDEKPDKVRIVSTSVSKIQRAARYFNRACALGKKEAFRYLGDIYYDGLGIDQSYLKAVEVYEQGVARNDAGSMFALGWMYEYGFSVQESSNMALELYKKAINCGCGEAMANMAHLKLHGKHTTCDHLAATRLLKKSITSGVFAAKEHQAWHYGKGIGFERDPRKSFELFREVFYGGNLLTTVELANCYDYGEGTERGPWEATRVYEDCMNAGTWHSEIYKAYYGLRLCQGKGAEKDIPRGRALIISSTKTRSSMPWHALGDCYRHGIGFRKDKKKAKRMYRRAISFGNGIHGIVGSYLALGEMFEIGEGGPSDIRLASNYYLEAANRLSTTGQWKSALAFETGVGQRRDLHRAVFYFRLCANSGHKVAQQKYGIYYVKGHGVEKSRLQSQYILIEAAKMDNNQERHLLEHIQEAEN